MPGAIYVDMCLPVHAWPCAIGSDHIDAVVILVKTMQTQTTHEQDNEYSNGVLLHYSAVLENRYGSQ